MTTTTAVLAARGICKSFGATQALRGVDLTLQPGEIHALLGGNGAGKSTLIKILSGQLTPDAGTLSGELAEHGAQVTVVHQELSVMPDLSITENLFLGDSGASRPFGWRRGAQRAGEVLAALGLDTQDVDPATRAGSLPLHQLQLVEIGRALARDSRIVLLDEPTAALTASETEVLFGVLRRLRDSGTSFVFVSHRMDEIRRIADLMTVIRDGVTAVDGVAVGDIDDAAVLSAMFGRSLDDAAPPPRESATSPRPGVGQVSADVTPPPSVAVLAHPALDAPLELVAGDVLGLAGTPVGPQALLDTLLGDRRASAWDVRLADGRRSPRSTREAVRRGIGYISGDRATKGVFPDLSIYDNALAARQVVLRRWTRVPGDRRHTDLQAARLDFRRADLTARPGSLSGGTQQKVLLARWLDLPVRLLLLEEPTRGVDLATKRDLYRIVRELADGGCAVIWWSTEYEELKQACHRTLAFDVRGAPAALLDMDDTDEHGLLRATGTA